MTAPGLPAFNALDAAGARRALLDCCASTAWATRVAAGRPYPDPESLYAAADAAVHHLDPEAMAEALAGHPRIGERPAGPGHRQSRREQAGVAGADQRVLDALAAGNAAYEQRFGHVYLVCATGRSAPELLAILESRLHHDPQTEDRVTRTELARINRIRLGRMLGQGGRAMATLSTHVLDTATGRPAAGVAVTLQDAAGRVLAEVVTDDDGRIRPLGGPLAPGDYRLTFATGDHFARHGTSAFHPRVVVEFTVTAADEHYHVPLLLSPFGYTTYRGS